MYLFSIYSVSSIFIAFFYLILGTFVFAKSPKSKINILFLLVTCAMALWGFGEGMMRASPDSVIANYWVLIMALGSTFHSTILLHFWFEFSGNKTKIKTYFLTLFYTSASIFFLLRILGKLTFGVEEHYWGYSAVGGGLYTLFKLLVVVLVSVVTMYYMFKTARESSGKLKIQAYYIGFGELIPFITGMVTQVFNEYLGLNIPELTVVATIFFISAVAWTINKHGLLTITTKVVAENIILTMDDFVIAVNNKMEIALINNAVTKNTDYGKDEMIGKAIDNFLKNKKLPLAFDELVKQLPLLNYELEILSKKKKKIQVSANISCISGQDGSMMGVVFVMRDNRKMNKLIMDLKKKEKELEETLEDFYSLRLGMANDMKKNVVDNENKKIKKRLDDLKEV
jgi:PAS domain-containing protein